MSSITPDAVREEIKENALVVGNPVKTAAKLQTITSSLIYADSDSKMAKTTVTASKPVYIDSSSVPQTGGFPFAVPMIAGASDTSAAVMTVQGSATGSADELMHLTLVKGANTTAVIAGYMRATITDDAGVITTGDYYVPFYTLT